MGYTAGKILEGRGFSIRLWGYFEQAEGAIPLVPKLRLGMQSPELRSESTGVVLAAPGMPL